MTQDLSRHKPLARANHLSPAELTKRDARMVEEDAAALARVQATRPRFPPHQHAYLITIDGGRHCRVCGQAAPEASA